VGWGAQRGSEMGQWRFLGAQRGGEIRRMGNWADYGKKARNFPK